MSRHNRSRQLSRSVVGGCFDTEFARWSHALVRDFRVRRFQAVVSTLVTTEIATAPEAVQRLYADLLALPAEVAHDDDTELENS